MDDAHCVRDGVDDEEEGLQLLEVVDFLEFLAEDVDEDNADAKHEPLEAVELNEEDGFDGKG